MNVNAAMAVHGRQCSHVVHKENEAMDDEGGPGYEVEYLALHDPTQSLEAHMESISVEAVREAAEFADAYLLHAFPLVQCVVAIPSVEYLLLWNRYVAPIDVFGGISRQAGHT